VAVHAIDFYNNASTIWAVLANDPFLSTFGPGEGYPSGVEYRWSDDHGNAVSVPAPVYIEKVLNWIADQMNDESKFPDDDDEEEALRVFQTPAFAALCGQIFRRLFRVYAIIYSSFFGTLEALGMAPHLNTCFKHVRSVSLSYYFKLLSLLSHILSVKICFPTCSLCSFALNSACCRSEKLNPWKCS
jgi:MOB kinase activator 1